MVGHAPDRSLRTLEVVNAHCAGEVGNVVVAGLPDIPGATMFDKKLWLAANDDQVRELMLFEPRGAVWHNANAVVPSNDPAADSGYLIMETTEYPAMSGSNTICVATVLLETGILPMTEPITELVLEAPVGLIRVRCECADGKVVSVAFVNQPAFCYDRDVSIDVPDIGAVGVDIVFGGMTYVMLDAARFGFAIAPAEARELCELGERVKAAAIEQITVAYPGNPDMPGITNLQWTGPLERDGDRIVSRNTVVVSPGRCDRSPCGTGTSARVALLHARGDLAVGETLIHESITGGRFSARIDDTTRVGPYDAVVPVIGGQAWITGTTTVTLDPSDPYPHGFTVADMWPPTSAH